MTAPATGIAAVARCLGCRGNVKVESEGGLFNCPLCGLTLVSLAGRRSLPPLVAPLASRDACWKALVAERRLPTEPGAVAIRHARLLLVPFWREADDAAGGAARLRPVRSGADLLPVGLPSLTAQRRHVAGLEVEPRTRQGDAMGRLEDPARLTEAVVVDVTRGPAGESPLRMVEALDAGPGGNGGVWWQLVYYPVWSFHYVVYDRESFHAVDAVTARPVGPARRVRAAIVALAAAAPMAAIFVALLPLAGAVAALPAWLGGLAGMRLTLRFQRDA